MIHTTKEKPLMRVFGQPDCQPCKAVTRKLDREHVDYEYVDVTQDAAALRRLRQQGMTSTPVVETPTEMFYGVQADKLSRAIDAARIESSRPPGPERNSEVSMR